MSDVEDSLLNDTRPFPTKTCSPRILTPRLIQVLVVVALLLLAGTSSQYLIISRKSPPPPKTFGVTWDVVENPCGSTPEEAKAMGCSFDVLCWCWLPEECIDRKLSEELLVVDDWHFYYDEAGLYEIPKIELGSGNTTDMTYTIQGYHYYHCTSSPKKPHRAWQNGWKMDGVTVDYEHTEHCEYVLVQSTTPYEAFTSQMQAKYPSC
jgi:hypothetical protein